MSSPTAEMGPSGLELTRAGLPATERIRVSDEAGEEREVSIACERPLTIYLDRIEIVTLMTLGTEPEKLALGYLRNQRLVERLEDIASVQVDWEVSAAAVSSRSGEILKDRDLGGRIVTSGCGQGTIFGHLLEELEDIRLPSVTYGHSQLRCLLQNMAECNEVYRAAGAVHGCALCSLDGEIEIFVEDVGRHNAVDVIAGEMWLRGCDGASKVFYTTGRLTSEMLIKVALMGVPVLVSRSGVSAMGLKLGQQLGVVMIARAKGRHFLVYSGQDHFVFGDSPSSRQK